MIFALCLPLLFVVVFAFALFRKVKVYDVFTAGVGKAVPFLVSVFPYVAAISLIAELFDRSGLTDGICNLLAPVLTPVGVPKEILRLILIKPFSGNGATTVFADLIEKFGADSYIVRCAAVVYGSSETVFYIGAVYFAKVREKKLLRGILISLFSTLASTVFACFLCRIL